MIKNDFWENCDVARFEFLLSNEKDLSRYKRIQCIYLRASFKLQAQQIAKIVSWSPGSVWNFQSDYKKRGELAFDVEGQGGRYHENMPLSQEEDLLSSLEKDAASGGILEVSRVKASYEEALGRKTHKTVVYRMLHRHGWRKIAPRKKHPNNDEQAIDDFKKSSRQWCRVPMT